MNNSFLGCLWDMDGVLVDTGPFHFDSWKEVLENYPIPFSEELFRQTFGMNNFGVISTLCGKSPTQEVVEEIANRKEEVFRNKICGHVSLLPGVHHWLEYFKELGIQQAVASSAPQANIDALLDELNIRKYFRAIVSGERMPGKPDPSVFLAAAKLCQVLPGDCVVIEDAVAGVEAAIQGGMKCIAVTTTNPAKLLQKAGRIVSSLEELLEEDIKSLFL